MRRPRTQYEQWQLDLVRDAYPNCVTRADKLNLCDRVGLASLGQLYNLAARLGASRQSLDFDPVTGTYIEFDYTIPHAWRHSAAGRA